MELNFIYVLPFLNLLSLNVVNEIDILKVFSLYLVSAESLENLFKWRDI